MSTQGGRWRNGLLLLAADHRVSFCRLVRDAGLSVEADRLRQAKEIIWHGFRQAWSDAGGGERLGILVDSEFGSAVAAEARAQGVTLAMAVERSGQDVFELEPGLDVAGFVGRFRPHLAKALVRWNPGDPSDKKLVQAGRLVDLGRQVADLGPGFLFELLVPPTEADLVAVDGDRDRFDRDLRPRLTTRAIEEIRSAGIEPDIWKIEGFENRADARHLGTLIQAGGRADVFAVVLGRGADHSKVRHWLQAGAGIPGYRGFAIGRSIWAAEVLEFLRGSITAEAAAAAVATHYSSYVEVYDEAVGNEKLPRLDSNQQPAG